MLKNLFLRAMNMTTANSIENRIVHMRPKLNNTSIEAIRVSTSAVKESMLYAFFWVIPRRLNFI